MGAPAHQCVVLDVSGLPPDVGTIDVLARFQLAAQRRGRQVQLRDASDDLRALVDFAGLGKVLCLEPRRQPEQREDAVGVEEERDLDDPAY
jgi:ABC-type transporter Mla MlaB component